MLPWSDRKPPRTHKKRPARPGWLENVQKQQHTTARSGPRRTRNPSETGREWEQRAAEWLTGQGLRPVASNVAGRRGEIDLIFADGQTAVVVEVRRRSSAAHGSAAESIDWHKRRRIAHTAMLWWTQTGLHCFRNLRFDTLTFTDSSQPIWTRHAFDAQGSI